MAIDPKNRIVSIIVISAMALFLALGVAYVVFTSVVP